MRHVYVVGRFPPPFDGQAIATRRVADLIERAFDVERLDVETPSAVVRRRSSVSWRTLRSNLRLRKTLLERLENDPAAPVVWPSISSSTAGHFRDRLVTMPTFGGSRRIIAVVHRGNFDQLFRHPLTRYSAERMTRRIDAFVFLTEQLASRCGSWIPPDKRVVIPNTIDEEMIPTDASVDEKQERRGEQDRMRLLFVANMIPSKGYMDVLRATAILRQRGRDVETHFAGQWMRDRDRSAFEQEVERHGLGSSIVHHGRVTDRSEIRRLYEGADVFLLPSYYENEAQPLSIIEALSAGTPVVTTHHAGIPEIVSSDEAEFVEARNPGSIADAVARLQPLSAWRRKSKNARSRFVATYAPKHVGARWLDLLNSADAASV